MSNGTQLDLVMQLNHHHSLQHSLCASLEEIADSLPDSANKQTCLVVSRLIYPTVKAAHTFEEQELFPHLERVDDEDTALDASLERLRFEHWEDESFAEELSECLREFATGNCSDQIDKLSYMIRGFFEGLKRHMAFEAEHLLPLVLQESQTRA